MKFLDRLSRKRNPISGCTTPEIPHVAVLLVHGVGSQEQGSTLLQWSHPIIAALGGWRSKKRLSADPVVSSRLDRTPDGPTMVIELDVPGDADHPHEHWMLAEVHWAADVKSPPVHRVISWLRREGGVGRLVSRELRLSRSFSPFASAAAGLLLLFYTAARGIASLLPLRALREAVIERLGGFLTGWVGDMQVLLGDPAQAAHLRTRLVRTAESLRKGGCQRIVLIAHSGGAVLSYMSMRELAARRVPIDTFITHGQGLRVAWELLGMTDTVAGCRAMRARAHPLADDIQKLHPGMVWRDFSADSDPVSLGEMNVPRCLDANVVSEEVWNQRSKTRDHGGYWDNTEQFLLPVMQLIDTGGRPSVISRFVRSDLQDLKAQRRRRVGVLATMRAWLTFLPALVLVTSYVFIRHGPVLTAADWVAEAATFLPFDEFIAWPVHWARGWVASSPAFNIAASLGQALLLTVLAATLWGMSRPIAMVDPAAHGPVSRRFLALAGYAAVVLAPLAGILFVSQDWVVGAAFWFSEQNVIPEALVAPSIGRPVSLFLMPLLAVISVVIAARILGAIAERSPRLWTYLTVAVHSALLPIIVAAPALMLVAVLAFPDLGRAAIATLILYLVFRLIQRIGEWRWAIWEERERSDALAYQDSGNEFWYHVSVALIVAAGTVMALGLLLTPSPTAAAGWMALATAAVVIVMLSTVTYEAVRAGRTPLPAATEVTSPPYASTGR